LVIFDFDQPFLANHCANCHAGGQSVTNLSEGHVEAVQYYHSNAESLSQVSPSDACLTCHSIDQPSVPASAATSNAPRFFVHASHPYGISYQTKRGRGSLSTVLPTNADVTLVDGRIECQTCHSLTRNPRRAFLESTSEGDLCVACHISNS
jgi:predicted CXXCH cytochrome family protein